MNKNIQDHTFVEVYTVHMLLCNGCVHCTHFGKHMAFNVFMYRESEESVEEYVNITDMYSRKAKL